VNYGQITDIIGDEPWIDSEITCLCNMASDCKIMLTLGSKRKSFDSCEITIGDWVTVTGHGNLFPRAQVKELDFSTNTAKVKWEISCCVDAVDISNLKPDSLHHTSKRKSMATDFYHNNQNKSQKQLSKQDESVSLTLNRNKFFNLENTSKYCAEGSVKNCFICWDLTTPMLHCSGNYLYPRLLN
jgi:hypothetical protein